MLKLKVPQNKESGFSAIAALMSISIGGAIVYTALRVNNSNSKALILMNKNDVILELKNSVIKSLDCNETIKLNKMTKCEAGKAISPVALYGDKPKDLISENFSAAPVNGIYNIKDVFFTARCSGDRLSLFYGVKNQGKISWSNTGFASVCHNINELIAEHNGASTGTNTGGSKVKTTKTVINKDDLNSEYILERSEINVPLQIKTIQELKPYQKANVFSGKFNHTYSFNYTPTSIMTGLKYNLALFTQKADHGISTVHLDVTRGGVKIASKMLRYIKNIDESFSNHMNDEVFLKLRPLQSYKVAFRFSAQGGLGSQSKFYFLPETKVIVKDFVYE